MLSFLVSLSNTSTLAEPQMESVWTTPVFCTSIIAKYRPGVKCINRRPKRVNQAGKYLLSNGPPIGMSFPHPHIKVIHLAHKFPLVKLNVAMTNRWMCWWALYGRLSKHAVKHEVNVNEPLLDVERTHHARAISPG